MRVRLYEVTVPHSTTKWFQVPSYDLPIIKLAWRGYLPAGKQVSVRDMGVVVFRSFADERIRVRRDYGTAPKEGGEAVWKQVYKNDQELEDAYLEAVKDGEALIEQIEAEAAKAEKSKSKAEKAKE